MHTVAWGGRNWVLITLLLATICLLSYLLIYIIIFFYIAIILLLVELFLVNFFRDPDRVLGSGIVSPADGKVISIGLVRRGHKTDYYRIAIFMSVFNVHVNRSPMPGRVIKMQYIHGRFIPAYEPDSKNNERLKTTMATYIGKIIVIQIAGILAKRIVPYITPGQKLNKGQRIGIIQFGSRVDLLLPKNRVRVLVSTGQNVKAGSSTIAKIL